MGCGPRLRRVSAPPSPSHPSQGGGSCKVSFSPEKGAWGWKPEEPGRSLMGQKNEPSSPARVPSQVLTKKPDLDSVGGDSTQGWGCRKRGQ